MNIAQQKGETVLIKQGRTVIEVIFSHYEKPNGNGSYWFDTKGNRYHIKDIA